MTQDNRDTGNHLAVKNDYKPWLVSGLLLASDLLAIVISFFLSYFIRKLLILIPSIGGVLNFETIAPLFLLIVIFILVIFVFAGFYPGHGRTGVVEFREIVYIVSFSHIIVAMIIPLSMLITFFLIQALGYTLNMIVLFSLILAVGMLVLVGVGGRL